MKRMMGMTFALAALLVCALLAGANALGSFALAA